MEFRDRFCKASLQFGISQDVKGFHTNQCTGLFNLKNVINSHKVLIFSCISNLIKSWDQVMSVCLLK